jgi:hypothetical protein
MNSKKSNEVDLVKELYATCVEMQKRVTQLIGNIANESVIVELLRINDDLNNVFLRYKRFVNSNPKQVDSNNKSTGSAGSASAMPQITSPPPSSSSSAPSSSRNNKSLSTTSTQQNDADAPSLIDFTDFETSTMIQNLDLNKQTNTNSTQIKQNNEDEVILINI